MLNRIYKAIQSAYCGNQCFSIFTACCYFNVDGKIKNSNVIVVTERSDHDRAASMSCFKKVVSKIESKHGKCYENSRFVFKLLAGTVLPNKSLMWFYNDRHHEKAPINGVGGTVKNVVFRKVKAG